MSYSTNPYKNSFDRKITMIDSLPELKDIESPEEQTYNNNIYTRGFNPASDIIPSEYSDKYQKVIRTNYVPPRESGMEPRPRVNYVENNYRINNKNINKNVSNRINVEQQPYDEIEDGNYDDKFQQQQYMRREYINCIEIANHIKNCPICSKLYGNTDKIFYIVVIIFLLIICLILLKNIITK